MEALLVRSTLRDCVLLRPHHLGSNIREVAEAHMKARCEGLCTRHGYIMPGSVGNCRVKKVGVEGACLNGDTRVDMLYSALVCNPPSGAVVAATVSKNNTFGVRAHCGTVDGRPVLDIIIIKNWAEKPSDPGVDLSALAPGDAVHVEIVGADFKLGDETISVVGRAVQPPKSGPQRGTAALQGPSGPLPYPFDARDDDEAPDPKAGNAAGAGAEDEDAADEGDEEEEVGEEEEGLLHEEDDEDGAEQDDEDEDGAAKVGVLPASYLAAKLDEEEEGDEDDDLDLDEGDLDDDDLDQHDLDDDPDDDKASVVTPPGSVAAAAGAGWMDAGRRSRGGA
jgi:DNA-directed RNA polymerase subunit E'/Rpb7